MKRINTKIKCKNLNKTALVELYNQWINNQLNLTTRRFTAVDLKNGQKKRIILLWQLKLRFLGEMGIIGVLVYQYLVKFIITDYVMSCRIMGEKQRILIFAAKNLNLKIRTMKAVLKPTKRNRPTIDVFKNSIMVEETKNNFF